MKDNKENHGCCCEKNGAAKIGKESDSAPERCNCGDSESGSAAADTKKTRTHAAVRKIRDTPKGTAAAKAPTNLADAANPKAG